MKSGNAVPQDWRAEKLGSLLLKVVGGGTPSRENESFWNGNIPWATVKDLKRTILHSAEESITPQALKESAANLIPKGTLIIATRMALGKAVFFTRDVAINQDLKALFPAKELAKQYLFHWLQHNAEVIERLGSGSTVKGIRLEVLKGLDFLLPPLPEQQKIAEILSTVDEKMAVIDEQLAQTQELKKGLMQRLLTKGIGHTAFKDSLLGEIPESWDVVKLESVSDFITKGSTPTTYGFGWVDKGIVFLRSECVGANGFTLSGAMFISDEAHKVMSRSIIKSGDLLMTITGNVGRISILPAYIEEANINQHIARIRINSSNMLSGFVYQYLGQESIIKEHSKIVTGQAYPQLSLKQVREMQIPFPPLPEQRQIAEILITVDDKLQVLTDKKAQYQELKRGLMQQLLTGQQRVRVAQPEEALS